MNLPQKQSYQWVITETNHIFSILSTLQNLPEAYSNRIEWLVNKPQIKHVSMGDMRVDIFDSDGGYSLEGHLELEQDEISLWEILPAVRTKSPYLLVQGDVWISITEHFRQKLTHLADTISPTQSEMIARHSHAVTLNSILSSGFTGEHSSLQNFISTVHPLMFDTTEFVYTLRPYQVEAVEWLLQLQQWTTGALLADEMGLGKTIQSLAFIHQIQSDTQEKTIIVAPKSTMGNWLNETRNCLLDWDIALYDGPNRKDLLQSIFPKQCLIMTYDIVTKDIEILRQHQWKTLILDEAQSIKNPESARHKSIRHIQADFTIALTGTPIENSLLDLWAIVNIILPQHLGSWKLFRQRFVKPIESGETNRLHDLRTLLSPFLKRRLKEDVTPDLPPKLEINEIIPLSLFERDTYDQIREQAQILIKKSPENVKFQILPLLTKLRQICCHRGLVIPSASDHSSKLDRALELIQEFHQHNRKVLIFSQFVQLLKKLQERITTLNMEYCYLDGSTPSHKRQEEIERFQNY